MDLSSDLAEVTRGEHSAAIAPRPIRRPPQGGSLERALHVHGAGRGGRGVRGRGALVQERGGGHAPAQQHVRRAQRPQVLQHSPAGPTARLEVRSNFTIIYLEKVKK